MLPLRNNKVVTKFWRDNMKKTIVYILVIAALILALSGCGDSMKDSGIQMTPRPEVTAKPQVSAMPDVNDGVVNDDNGVITEGDNGPMETRAPATPKPRNTAAPKPSASPAP